MTDTGLADEVNVSAAAARPRALIVSVYGLYAREVGGWISVSSLIRLMSRLGVEEAAVRSSISRLKRRGILEAERVDGSAGYALSSEARQILDDGDRRIFERRRATLGEGWVLAVFSVVVFAALAGTLGAFFLERRTEPRPERSGPDA